MLETSNAAERLFVVGLQAIRDMISEATTRAKTE
jgi:hypothetical protein